jgi:hypothetical protein
MIRMHTRSADVYPGGLVVVGVEVVVAEENRVVEAVVVEVAAVAFLMERVVGRLSQ